MRLTKASRKVWIRRFIALMSGGATVGRLGDESTLGAGRDGLVLGNGIGEWREFVQLLRKRNS
jgi:hypothetical protein